jgi:hypothetical protein
MARIVISDEVERLATLAVDAAFAIHMELGPGQVLPVHRAQVITCLKWLRFPLGLLINFNEVLIKNGIQRILNIEKT